MGPTDPKGHIVLTDLNLDMFAISLSIQRNHTTEGELLDDKRDILDVMEVIRAHDCMVISQGGIENLLTQIRTFLVEMAKGPKLAGS